MDKLNRELDKLEREVELATSYMPEGYRIAKDTLSERVKLMVDGLKAYSAERSELLEEIKSLEAELEEVRYQLEETERKFF